MTATRRDFLSLLGGLVALPMLPAPLFAGGRPGSTLPPPGSDVLIASRIDRRLSLYREGQFVRSVRIRTGPGSGLANGVYTLADDDTQIGVSLQRSGIALVLLSSAPETTSPMHVPAGFLAQGPARIAASATPLIVVDQPRLKREVLAVSRLPAWPGAVGLAGWLGGEGGGGVAPSRPRGTVGPAQLLVVVGSERSIYLVRNGKIEGSVATALRNPRQPLVASAHMLTSSLRGGGGAEWMHLSSADDTPSLAAQLARLEPLDRTAMGTLWNTVGPGTVLVIANKRETTSGIAHPLLVSRAQPATEADTTEPASSPGNRPPRAPRRPRQRPARRLHRARPRPEAPATEPWPPTRERYPGANSISEYG